MINEDEQINSSHKSWLWSDCKLVLRRTNPNNPTEESYQNLEAQVELECQQISEPFIPILTFEQPLNQDTSVSYSWKKGTSLPTLTVKLQQSYFNLLKQDQQLIMIYCQLTVAFPNRKQTHFYLEEVKTLGDKCKQFSDQGIVQFSNILLKQCSVQKGNNKFSLLIRICASSADQSRIILKTLISTSFFVLNSRIKRKYRKPKLTIKLISPKKFLKPLTQLKQFESNYNQQNVLKFLRNLKQSAQYILQTHPLHMIYHYSDFLKLHYNSKEVTDLYEFLEKIVPGIDDKHEFMNLKNSCLKYELKKIKSIKKNKQNQGKKIRKKLQLIIKTSQNKMISPQTKLLLVTFKQSLIEKITNIIDEQKSQNGHSIFETELHKQVQNLGKIFTQWTNFCIEIDFLRQQPESVYWKDIQKDKVYEAYSKHYQMTKNRFLTPERDTVMVNQQNNHQEQSN